MPTKNERKDIFRLHLKKRLTNPEVAEKINITEELLTALADLTEGFVGAEIEQAVITFTIFAQCSNISFNSNVSPSNIVLLYLSLIL